MYVLYRNAKIKSLAVSIMIALLSFEIYSITKKAAGIYCRKLILSVYVYMYDVYILT